MNKMKAILIDKYGDSSVLRYGETDRPKPGRGQVLVKIHFAAINPVDWKTRSGYNRILLGGFFPKILGHDLSGEVVEVGSGVKHFKVGDHVFGMLGLGLGAYAEYVAASESVLAVKPGNTSFEEAAAIPLATLTSLQALRDRANIKAGMKVAINGASGGVGLYAVQLAKYFKTEVTATCSPRNFELVKAQGADQVIDYKTTDLGDKKNYFDIIYDCVGTRSFNEDKDSLTANGIFVSTKTKPLSFISAQINNTFSIKKDKQVLAIPNHKDMVFIKELLENGDLKSVLDSNYLLSEMAEAHEYSESGRAHGKITIKI